MLQIGKRIEYSLKYILKKFTGINLNFNLVNEIIIESKEVL